MGLMSMLGKFESIINDYWWVALIITPIIILFFVFIMLGGKI